MWFPKCIALLVLATWHWMLCGWYREKHDRLGSPNDSLKADANEQLGDMFGSALLDNLPK